LQLSSTAFRDAEDIPRRFTCDGENVSPPLQWTDVPSAAKSFALLCDDPDAPSGVWRHWAAYDIPPARTGLPEHLPAKAKGLKQAVNDFGRPGYGGPCPPHGHGAHHYRFTLLALDTDGLGVHAGASCKDVERAARRHALAEAQLTGVYRR
jgi:Raf kinase inhibitor-like YbhB/YbcL family protein